MAFCGEEAERATALLLSDAHFHLGFVLDPAGFAIEAQRARSLVFAASVTPREYRDTKRALCCAFGSAQMKASSTNEDAKGALCCVPDPGQAKAEATIGVAKGALCRAAAPSQLAVDFPFIKLAVGLHPWWVPADEGCLAEELRAFDGTLSETSYVGEVGLDFSKRRIATRDAQLCAFRHIAGACAKEGGKVLSIHCVKAYDDALSILKSSGCLASCTCIFHWFSGSFPQLAQAMDAGCFFSVSARMLETKKGREYAKAIPLQKMLLETDAPAVVDPEREHPSIAYSYDQMRRQLAETLQLLAQIRDIGEAELAAIVQQNAREVFS
ncbi:MAG: TatD family hydrolase [Eggerthella sp.]|nr:TatD family hydrolase [Eggerthella sp.]